MALSNLDCYYLVRELKHLEGQHVQKVYGKDNVFRLKFRNVDVVVRLPDALFLAKNPPAFEEHPSSFVMLLRKHLTGKLLRVEQINFDRILRFWFENASLVVELFSDGNLLLCDAENKIIKPWRAEEFAARKLLPKQSYSPPPMEKKHPLEFSHDGWAGLKGKIVSALSKNVNLSPFYLEEACARAGVALDKKVEELSEEERKAIENSLKSLFEGFSPTNYGSIASPIRLKKSVLEGVTAESFSELLEQTPLVEEKKKDKKTYLLERQKKALAEFEEKEREALAKAEWLKNNVGVVQEILEDKKTSLKVTRKGFLVELET